MIDLSKFEGRPVQSVIDSIKQKHFSEIDVEDYAFLQANAGFLSDADKRIYLNGEDPKEVVQDSTALTANERRIHENRILQDAEYELKRVRQEAVDREAEATKPKTGEAQTETDKKIVEERKLKAESLKKEVEAVNSEKPASEAKSEDGEEEVEEDGKKKPVKKTK